MSRTAFRYELIADKSLRKRVQSQAHQIQGLLQVSAAAVVEIGRRMQDVYDGLSAALFRAWVECEFGWNRSTASNYMQAARVFGDCDCLQQIQPSALIALSRQNVPASVSATALDRARNGELVTLKSVQQLLQAAGVQPNHASAGVARKPHTAAAAVAVAALAADPAAALRETLDTFVVNIDRLAESLSKDDRNAIADRFLQLAIQIRGLGGVATPRRKPAAVS